MLHHVGMIWIIENNKDLKYDMDILNSDYMTGGPCYLYFQKITWKIICHGTRWRSEERVP